MFARPIQIVNSTNSLRTAVLGTHVRTAQAGALTVPGTLHRTKPDGCVVNTHGDVSVIVFTQECKETERNRDWFK